MKTNTMIVGMAQFLTPDVYSVETLWSGLAQLRERRTLSVPTFLSGECLSLRSSTSRKRFCSKTTMRGTARLFLAAPGAKSRAASAAKKAAIDEAATSSNLSSDVLQRMARPLHPPPPLAEEERQRRRRNMKAYGRLRRAQWLEGERKANVFLAAKWAAIDALPGHARRVEAIQGVMPNGRVLEERVLPLDAPTWTETPPIPGFNVGDLTGN